MIIALWIGRWAAVLRRRVWRSSRDSSVHFRGVRGRLLDPLGGTNHQATESCGLFSCPSTSALIGLPERRLAATATARFFPKTVRFYPSRRGSSRDSEVLHGTAIFFTGRLVLLGAAWLFREMARRDVCSWISAITLVVKSILFIVGRAKDYAAQQPLVAAYMCRSSTHRRLELTLT